MGKKNKALHKNSSSANTSSPDSLSASPGGAMINWLIALVIILPILFSRETMDPAIAIRFLFLNIFMLAFIIFFVIKKNSTGISFPPMVKMIFAAGILFGCWNIVSMFFAANKAAGYYETGRHLGNVLLLFIITIAIIKDGSHILRLCKTIVVLSLFHSIVGILQFYDIAFTTLVGFYPPYGFMTNRNLFGSAQVLLIPFVLFTFYKAPKNWKYISGIALTAIIISLLLSQTRSAWLATVVLLLVSFILMIILLPHERKKILLAGVSIVVLMVLFSVLFITTNKNTALGKSLQERFSSFARQNADTAAVSTNESARLQMWSRTIRMIKDNPLTGAGPDNWKVAITKYEPAGMPWADVTYVPDRPHNVYLQTTSETGIPGALFYFGGWILLAIIGFKSIFKKQEDDRRVLSILMLGGMAAFAADSVFSFPSERMEHSLYFLLMAGIVIANYTQLSAAITHDKKSNPVKWLILFTMLCSFNLLIGMKKYNFEEHTRRAYTFELDKDYQGVLEEVEAGKSNLVTISPYGTPLELYSSIAYKEMKDYEKALQEINVAKKYHPYNAKVYNNMGAIYANMKDYDNAITSFKNALLYAPAFKIPAQNLAEIYLFKGEYAACIETLQKINLGNDEYLKGILSQAQSKLAAQQ